MRQCYRSSDVYFLRQHHWCYRVQLDFYVSNLIKTVKPIHPVWLPQYTLCLLAFNLTINNRNRG